MSATPARKRILAVASSGGHWIQLARLRPAFEGHEVSYLTTSVGHRDEVEGAPFYTVNDANRWNKVALVVLALRVAWVVLRVRPRVVISTGATPGLLAVFLGKLIGARTAWVDSIANAEELSLSGRLAGRFADLWLTQWPHLARQGGPGCAGSVL